MNEPNLNSMQTDFDQLRQHLVYEFEDVVKVLRESSLLNKTGYDVILNGARLEPRLRGLRKTIVRICSLKNPDTGKSLVDDPSFKLDNWVYQDLFKKD